MYKSLRQIKTSEADTLKAICDWLDIRQSQGTLIYLRHSPSNVVGKKGEATFRRPRASQLGAPDLVVLKKRDVGGYGKDGVWYEHVDVFCIEAKSPTGKPSKIQDQWAELAVAQGARYLVVRSLDDVMEGLR